MQAAQVPFAKVATPKAGPVPTTLLGPLKWVGVGFASLLFLFFMSRSLRKREGEALAAPAWLADIEEPVVAGRARAEDPRPRRAAAPVDQAARRAPRTPTSRRSTS